MLPVAASSSILMGRPTQGIRYQKPHLSRPVAGSLQSTWCAPHARNNMGVNTTKRDGGWSSDEKEKGELGPFPIKWYKHEGEVVSPWCPALLNWLRGNLRGVGNTEIRGLITLCSTQHAVHGRKQTVDPDPEPIRFHQSDRSTCI